MLGAKKTTHTTISDLEKQFGALAKKANAGGGSGGAGGSWWQTTIDRGLTYLEQKDAQKRADALKQQGVDAQVTQRQDGTFAVEERPPLWKNPFVLGGAAIGVLLLLGLVARRNPPRRRR